MITALFRRQIFFCCCVVKRCGATFHYPANPMKSNLATICLLTSALNAAWVIEDIPTGIQSTRSGPALISKELTSAYRAIYDASGSKTGEKIAIAYRSLYLYVVQRQGAGWSSIRFDDNGRYPSIALDNSGNPHMSYFRTSNNKLYYAHPVSAGTGNCGPSAGWACEVVPTSIYGAPIGLSAITVHGSKVHILVESSSGNATYPSMVTRLTKTIGAADWDASADQVSYAKDLVDLDIKIDSAGAPQVLLNSEYLDWYRRPTSYWTGIGPLVGNGSFDMTSSGAPRICYRDFAGNRLIYARSNGTDYWTETVVDYDIGSKGSCSIAVPEATGGIQVAGYSNPRIAYYDDISDSVKYATPPTLTAQPWSVQTVATATGTRTIDLHLDKQGRASIIYFNSTNLKLQLAKWQ
jgi:hypothetical protein